MTYLKTLVARTVSHSYLLTRSVISNAKCRGQSQQNAGQAVGSPQMRPSPRPRPPPNFAGQTPANVNNAQGVPGLNTGAANPTANPAAGSGISTQSALIQRLCAQAGITVQHFQTLTQPQQQAFVASQASLLRQNANRAQAANGGTPGQTSSPGQMVGRPLPAGLQQQPTQGSPAVPGLQPGLNINGVPGQAQGGIQTPAQAAAIAVAAAAGNPALQARLMQMRAQGQPMTQALQNQLAAVAAAQNKGQPNPQAGALQGIPGMMNQAGQPGANQMNPMMNSQSPRPPSEGLPGGPGGQQGNAPGTPGSQNGQNPASQKQYQEIHNILSNLPEFMKMKEENRLSDQQKKMVCANPFDMCWLANSAWRLARLHCQDEGTGDVRPSPEPTDSKHSADAGTASTTAATAETAKYWTAGPGEPVTSL